MKFSEAERGLNFYCCPVRGILRCVAILEENLETELEAAAEAIKKDCERQAELLPASNPRIRSL